MDKKIEITIKERYENQQQSQETVAISLKQRGIYCTELNITIKDEGRHGQKARKLHF